MVGRYPLAAMFIELGPEEVDVNVHPAKAEVRFRSPDKVFSGVQRAIRRALLAYSPVPSVASQAWQKPALGRTTDPAWDMPREIDGQGALKWDTLVPSETDAAAEEGLETAALEETTQNIHGRSGRSDRGYAAPAAVNRAGGPDLPDRRRAGRSLPD
jgi:DNA mismatch repair ATPase MutL